MFRRHWSGLPKDVFFPSTLRDLGYFINDEDEIRSLHDPDCYFKYFVNRNTRINQRQRFGFDNALEDIIHRRIEEEGLLKTPLPLGTPPSEKHVPIFMDADLHSKSRIVIIFGETDKALGLLAGRIANGRGGVNKGSMVSVVKELRTQRSAVDDSSPPGIVLANVGQLYWWPDGKRALTVSASSGIPLPSLVHTGRKYVRELNAVEGQETPEMHIQHVFEEVLAKMIADNATVDVVAIGATCALVERFLDEKKNWDAWGCRLSSLLLMDTIYEMDSLTNEDFKGFLAKRSRCYLRCIDPVDTPLAPPSGNRSLFIAPLGIPCYSSSEPNYVECVLITALRPALSYLQRNALAPEAENETITIIPKPKEEIYGDEDEGKGPQQELTDEVWDKVDDASKPAVNVIAPEEIEKQRRLFQMWKQFEETGMAPHPDLAGVTEPDTEAKPAETESNGYPAGGTGWQDEW